MLSKTSHREKDKYYITFIWNLKTSRNIETEISLWLAEIEGENFQKVQTFSYKFQLTILYYILEICYETKP